MTLHRSSIRPSGPRRAPARNGFSLLEVLVVVVIFSIGLVGLVATQARATQYSVSAEDSNRASLLAQDLTGRMWAANTLDLPAADIAAWQARVADSTGSGLPEGNGQVVVNGNVARITISWRAPATGSAEQNRYVTDVTLGTP